MVHIIGSGDAPAQEDEKTGGQDESRRVYVTNFFSFGHLIPWGGSIDVRRIPTEEIKSFFENKRVDLFAWPDLELMRDMVQQAVMLSGQAPQGTQEEHEAAFCQMVHALVEQATGAHVRIAAKPKPAAHGKKQIFVQIYMTPSNVMGGGGLGAIWWEIAPKEIREKPEVKT
jgi:hypothetical protein